MPRARNIKPSFFSNDELAELEPLNRLLFIGLWCWADREGRLEDRPKRLKAEILPYDDCDVDKFLDALHNAGFIIRYEINGERYIQVTKFKKHQNPHIKEPASEIPAPDAPGAVIKGRIHEHGSSMVQAQCKHGASMVQEPEEHNSDPADSGFRIPDPDSSTSTPPPPSPTPNGAGEGAPVQLKKQSEQNAGLAEDVEAEKVTVKPGDEQQSASGGNVEAKAVTVTPEVQEVKTPPALNAGQEGWVRFWGIPKAHYVRQGRTLCGKYSHYGGAFIDRPEELECCGLCLKGLAAASCDGTRAPFSSKKQEQLFDRFWQAYPKKRSKGQAEKAWAKINPDEQLVDVMLAAIERAKKSKDWRKEGGRYIPYPATWLNAKGWEDDYQPLEVINGGRRQEHSRYPQGEDDYSDLVIR